MILRFYSFSNRFYYIACTSWSPPATIIFLIFLAFEAISFSLFTAIMTGTQLYSIYTDTTVCRNKYFVFFYKIIFLFYLGY